MKAQSTVAAQATLLNLRAVTSVGSVRGDQAETVKSAQTARPVVDVDAGQKARGRSRDAALEPDGASVQKTKLQFSVDEPSGRMVVSIVDRDTAEVVRQIPAEDMLAIARQIEERLRDAGTTDGFFVTDEA